MASQPFLTTINIESIKSKVAGIFEHKRFKNIAELPDNKLLELFDYLIPDWKLRDNTGRSGISYYSLSEKNNVIVNETEIDLIQQLIDMLKNKEKEIFHFYSYQALYQLIHEITNDGIESMETYIRSRISNEFDQYLDGINEEFKKCLKLTLVGSAYLCDYNFEENVTEEKIELLEYLFTGQLSRFELSFREYVDKQKRNLGSYHRISLKPVTRFYYKIAKNQVKRTTKATRKQYHYINCQKLISHSFPEVEENSSLITKFYEQRHLRIFDDTKKYEEYIIWIVVLCRVATRSKELRSPTHDQVN